MAKINRSVVRNEAYPKSSFLIRERHNERINEHYYNSDIQPDRQHLNVHFKRCESSYANTFDNMIANGTIKIRGQKKDGSSKVFDELVFDVNTAYFENHGGYEYAKSFFEEAYRYAIEEIGGEQYVISAIMHADERNIALSEKLGFDQFHYHLHIVYIPVVRKEIRYRIDNKNPELAGKLKEVITQVSHSKKWPKFTPLVKNGQVKRNDEGKAIQVNSYSLLQDHFYEHMREAGFIGFERGERGSTAEHLSVLEFKTKQESARVAAMSVVVEEKEDAVAVLDSVIKDKEQIVVDLNEQTVANKKRLDNLEARTAVAKKESATVGKISGMVKPMLFSGNLQISPADWKTVSNLAKEGVKSRGIIAELKKQISKLTIKVKELAQKLTRYEGMGLSDSMKYYYALQRAPRRLAETVDDIRRQPPEIQEKHMEQSPHRKRSHEQEI